uniref:Uncharacterized protein n=1 Tax=Timema tahoe TaxID=61484 RepID=A0A7R9FEV7_9NEOP|nr:unnamed protein product [Timema tahoe]
MAAINATPAPPYPRTLPRLDRLKECDVISVDQSVPAPIPVQRKKSLPDVQGLPKATDPMSREEVSVLSSARREEIRKMADEAERLRANPLLYLVSPHVKVRLAAHGGSVGKNELVQKAYVNTPSGKSNQIYSSPMASLVLTDSSQLTSDSQHLAERDATSLSPAWVQTPSLRGIGKPDITRLVSLYVRAHWWG